MSPHSGPAAGGQSVTVTGWGFQPGAQVTVGGAAASQVTVVTSTLITLTTPAGSAGVTSIRVVNPDGGTGTLAGVYTYEATPTITAVTPSTGTIAGGESVTVRGTGFAADSVVTIGGVEAYNVTVVDADTVTAIVPVGTKAGAAIVEVTNPGVGSADLDDGFTYLAVEQDPVRPLALSKRLSAKAGWQDVVRVPIPTNAGQRATVRVTCTPARDCQVRTHEGHVQVAWTGSPPSTVTVRVTAPASGDFAPMAIRKTYRITGSRNSSGEVTR